MNMHKGLVGVAALVLSAMAVPAQAEIFDLSIGDNSFRGAFYGPLSRIVSDTNGQYDVGVVLKPKRDDDLFVAHVGALVTGDAGARDFNLAAGLGVRGVYIGRDHDSGGALALGGQAEGRYPGYERIGLSVYGYFAPDVICFGEFDEYYEIGTALDYQVLKNASVYVGYRNVHVEHQNGQEFTADNGLHLGMRLSF